VSLLFGFGRNFEVEVFEVDNKEELNGYKPLNKITKSEIKNFQFFPLRTFF